MKEDIIKNKIGQVKIQETAFMLVALIFFLSLIFLVYSNYKVREIYTLYTELQKEKAITLLDKFVSLPEFSCLYGRCIDLDKVLALGNISGYHELWRGISKIEVIQLYPISERYVIYKKGNSHLSYATFVPLCKTEYSEGYVWQKCTLGKLLIGVEKPLVETSNK